MERRKVYARYLYVYQGLSGKECAQKVMVTEKTIGAWVVKYDWRNEREALYKRTAFADMENKALADILLGRLRVFLSAQHPRLYKQIEKSIEAFIVHNINAEKNKENS